MPRPDYRALCRLALEAISIEPQGIRRADVWTMTQASKRAGARVALRGALDEAEDPNLEEDIARHLRNEMSRCRCEVPRECQFCQVREQLLVRLGWWGTAEQILPASEPAVEGTRTVADEPAKPALSLVAHAASRESRS